MTKPILAITLAISTCMTSACGPAPAPELKVFVSGAARDAFNDLAPQFERATGYKIKAEFDLPPALMRRIGAGEPFDVVILSRGIDELIEHGKVAPDSRVALGRTGVGVAIHRGRVGGLIHGIERIEPGQEPGHRLATTCCDRSHEESSDRYAKLVQHSEAS